jgi:hypothetical protein
LIPFIQLYGKGKVVEIRKVQCSVQERLKEGFAIREQQEGIF